MKKAIWKSIAVGLIAIAAAVQGALAAPASFAYQGVIHELDGKVPANKNRVIEFRLYDGPTSTNVLWGRACNVLLDEKGLFNAPLADASGTDIEGVPDSKLAEVLAQNSGTTLYVGLTVDGSSGEISPRQAILSVPYAIHADDAASASGGFVVAGEVTAGALTVNGAATLGATEAERLAVKGNVEITGEDGMFVGPGTIPVGGIIMWSGAADHIPEGWALCNGQTKDGVVTPNLSGKFVVGYDSGNSDYNRVCNTGGVATVTLTVNHMPKHSHGRTVKTAGGAGVLFEKANPKYLTWEGNEFYYKGSISGEAPLGASDSAGGDQPHENRPPFFVICYIMRVK